MLNSILPCNWEILISPGNMSARVLSCQSLRPEDSENVVELSLIGEAFSRNAFQMEGELNSELADVIIQRRALFEQAYIQLRQAHPALPAQLRHFQVSCIPADLCPEKKIRGKCIISGRRCCRCHIWHRW